MLSNKELWTCFILFFILAGVVLPSSAQNDPSQLWGIWIYEEPEFGEGSIVVFLPDGYWSYFAIDSIVHGSYTVNGDQIILDALAPVMGTHTERSFVETWKYQVNADELRLSMGDDIWLSFAYQRLHRFTPLEFLTCPDTLDNRLFLGGAARVPFTEGSSTRLRAEPTTAASIIQDMSEGTAFRVADGPVCADGYTWWKVSLQHSPSGEETAGWVAEGADGERFVELFGTTIDSSLLRQLYASDELVQNPLPKLADILGQWHLSYAPPEGTATFERIEFFNDGTVTTTDENLTGTYQYIDEETIDIRLIDAASEYGMQFGAQLVEDTLEVTDLNGMHVFLTYEYSRVVHPAETFSFEASEFTVSDWDTFVDPSDAVLANLARTCGPLYMVVPSNTAVGAIGYTLMAYGGCEGQYGENTIPSIQAYARSYAGIEFVPPVSGFYTVRVEFEIVGTAYASAGANLQDIIGEFAELPFWLDAVDLGATLVQGTSTPLMRLTSSVGTQVLADTSFHEISDIAAASQRRPLFDILFAIPTSFDRSLTRRVVLENRVLLNANDPTVIEGGLESVIEAWGNSAATINTGGSRITQITIEQAEQVSR